MTAVIVDFGGTKRVVQLAETCGIDRKHAIRQYQIVGREYHTALAERVRRDGIARKEGASK